jgi:putative ABC transport system substrate-binding protein
VRRRDFITLLGGAAVAWPLAARAQQSERRIGVFTSGSSADDPQIRDRIAAFLRGLQGLGWTEGRNIRIEFREGGGNPDTIRKYAAELAALSPDVIFTTGAASLSPLLLATRRVPIVFAIVPDPVGSGFVDSLARPGRQRHWIHAVRVQPNREMARITQTNRAGRDARGCPS